MLEIHFPGKEAPTMNECIDLKEHFGNRYKVTHEESYQAESGESGRLHDPWLLKIPCTNGHIYPHGSDFLAASTNHRRRVAKRLAALPGVEVRQDGDDGINVVFHVDDFEEVAAIMHPRRKRRLTTDQRTENLKRLREHQFRSAAHDAGSDHRRDASGTSESEAA